MAWNWLGSHIKLEGPQEPPKSREPTRQTSSKSGDGTVKVAASEDAGAKDAKGGRSQSSRPDESAGTAASWRKQLKATLLEHSSAGDIVSSSRESTPRGKSPGHPQLSRSRQVSGETETTTKSRSPSKKKVVLQHEVFFDDVPDDIFDGGLSADILLPPLIESNLFDTHSSSEFTPRVTTEEGETSEDFLDEGSMRFRSERSGTNTTNKIDPEAPGKTMTILEERQLRLAKMEDQLAQLRRRHAAQRQNVRVVQRQLSSQRRVEKREYRSMQRRNKESKMARDEAEARIKQAIIGWINWRRIKRLAQEKRARQYAWASRLPAKLTGELVDLQHAMHRLRYREKDREAAAVKLQAWWRCIAVRRGATVLKLAMWLETLYSMLTKAAVMLQARGKAKLQRQYIKSKLLERRLATDKKRASAMKFGLHKIIVVQRAFRLQLSRRKLAALRAEFYAKHRLPKRGLGHAYTLPPEAQRGGDAGFGGRGHALLEVPNKSEERSILSRSVSEPDQPTPAALDARGLLAHDDRDLLDRHPAVSGLLGATLSHSADAAGGASKKEEPQREEQELEAAEAADRAEEVACRLGANLYTRHRVGGNGRLAAKMLSMLATGPQGTEEEDGISDAASLSGEEASDEAEVPLSSAADAAGFNLTRRVFEDDVWPQDSWEMATPTGRLLRKKTLGKVLRKRRKALGQLKPPLKAPTPVLRPPPPPPENATLRAKAREVAAIRLRSSVPSALQEDLHPLLVFAPPPAKPLVSAEDLRPLPSVWPPPLQQFPCPLR
eukprot:TRINITY_DN6353_c0_g1_i1.p1 TRINITY_DN6353_c0_g1~~TRINITY_DN6353_c0_g1_i1.p1  ORF type:complete len:778 (+),score=212.18 TRINITY_DN6353_c0_g1_i1:176-2509(+)